MSGIRLMPMTVPTMMIDGTKCRVRIYPHSQGERCPAREAGLRLARDKEPTARAVGLHPVNGGNSPAKSAEQQEVSHSRNPEHRAEQGKPGPAVEKTIP